MKKRMRLYILAGLMVSGLLLALLVLAESGSPQSGIRTVWDALWYSLVTLTTVGYGDLYPVSPLGRAVGLVFVLLSVGILASVLGTAASFLRNRLIPRFRLEQVRRKRCFIFSEVNGVSLALAEDLLRREQRALVVFCRADEGEGLSGMAENRRVLRFSQDAVELAAQAGGADKTVFLMSGSIVKNYEDAQALRGAAVTLYCRAPETDGLPHAHFFEDTVCAARAYWQRNPLDAEESTVLLAGDGSLARELLSQAILMNCRLPFHATVYHLFGDWEEYRLCHPGLATAFALSEGDPGRDALIFHPEPWQAQPQLLGHADRIIFCGDDPEKNAGDVALLNRCFPVSGRVFGAAPAVAAPGVAMGSMREVATAEIVMHSALDARAKALHRLYCRRTGSATPWEALSPLMKASNRAAADHLLTQIRLLLPGTEAADMTPALCREAAARWQAAEDKEPYRRNEHERWLRFYTLYNWRYGPKKDAQRRTHPCIVPYDDLPPQEREKDDGAWMNIVLMDGEGEKEA